METIERDMLEQLKYLESQTAKPNAEPVPTRMCFREISGQTFNKLQDCCQVLRILSTALEGDADALKNEPEIKCYRDALMMNLELSCYILKKLNEIAEDIGT